MLFLLDTNAVRDAVVEQAQMRDRLSRISSQDSVATCTIVRGEVLFGIERMPAGRRREQVMTKTAVVLNPLPCHSVPASAAEQYARVKIGCQRKGVPLDENDLWIAATALALGATLVSRDSDFGRVDGLAVVDWTK